MPRWDFECPHCGRREEHTFKSYRDIDPPVCPYCDFWYDVNVLMRQQPAAPNFSLKGAGFHKNDYPNGR